VAATAIGGIEPIRDDLTSFAGNGRAIWSGRRHFQVRRMPPKANPAKLNPLQLRTLTLLQAIARIPGAASATPDGDIAITQFPHAHGDHFHLGDAMVSGRDATGLENQAVWNALTRKGMIKSEWPHQIALTPDGQSYDTGLADEILRRGSH
jgi:hypothetical protein